MRSSFLKDRVVLGAALISFVGSAAYLCMLLEISHPLYSLFRDISWIGMPGIMFSAVLTSAAEGISMPTSRTAAGVFLLLISALGVPAGNFLFYLGLGLATRKLVRRVSRRA
jgi:hypothetical protein